MLTVFLKILFKTLFFLKLDLFVYWLILKSGKSFYSSNDKKKCIVINRSIFQEDMKILEKKIKDVKFVYIHKLFFQAVYECYFNKKKISHNNFYLDKNTKKRKLLQKRYNKMLKYFKSKDFIFFASGNFNYVELFDLFKVSNQNNIKILIVFKEGFGVKKDNLINFFKKYSHFDFNIDLITFTNNLIKDCAVSYINFVNNKNSLVIGIPRLEGYIRNYKTTNLKLLYSSYPYDKINLASKFNKEDKDDIIKKIELMHLNFLKYAKKNNKLKFIIKTKNHIKYINYVNIIKKKYFNKYKFDNLIITNDNFNGKILDLADTVVSWGSTTILEALYCNKKVLVPKINEKIDADFNLTYKNEEEKKKLKNYYEYNSYHEFEKSLDKEYEFNQPSLNDTIEQSIPNFNAGFKYNLNNFF